ncbi:glycerol-3-phosphate dehydrogenase/oxidase [Prolixibacter denitrificans]|uniref:Uncharacterized protein n=1 Tax=Prolixibacter denitrificans TaxID=1541063 RepID=A0A2P8CHU0_9BACT|nr:glycerol-3-phosphate dehydrogenase/oxidase [Prolixibacter denitrificans]PSK84537.1 hypothetical protein CLV93_102326 [Prolixibacter denitrificans]GET20708.1 hypothetical protein JCM18694_09540 [Prolixibacter denitrificans]
MKKAPSARIFNDLNETDFDVVFLGVNLPGVLIAYQLASAGKKVALFIEGDFERQDDFRFTRMFPETMKELSGVGSRLDYAAQMQQSAPHLFLQQRMVWLRGNALSNQLITRSYNQLAVRNHSEKAGTLKLGDYPEFSFFRQSGYTHGILCREYRYNHSRLMLEWLKTASREGALVGNFIKATDRDGRVLQLEDLISKEKKKIKAERVIQLTADSRLFQFEVRLPDTEWKNPVRISGEFADYILSRGKESVRATAFAEDTVNDEKQIIDELKQLFSLSHEDILPVENRKQTSAIPVKPDLTIPDFLAEEMSEKLANLFPGITEWKIPDSWFSGEDDRHISQVFELAQRKFYEAKQTGIDEAWFMELFYRFGPAINDLTELAYDAMSETRDPLLLWEQAISRYEQANEWRIS